ncbi:hypothetical protein [Hyphomicrobium sp.]|uniref:hypothetical protein n=1 Tax=Hyphomicrobium sp. TaxID=82 RepID=UPI001D716D1F|nr:hypothetical protein [Hyphomicrobium sp.]MBY0562458.1 hypothetical protein [Hyphomicrobium sp.]
MTKTLSIYRGFKIVDAGQDGILTEGCGKNRNDVGGPYDTVDDARADIDNFWVQVAADHSAQAA